MTSARRLLEAGSGLLLAVTVAACGNASQQTSHAGNTDGVFADRIVLGALASETGPLPADFAPVVTGAKVYLDMVNASGGVDGRKLDLAYTLDDQSSPSIDASQARTLVAEDHVFAVVAVATPSFSGGTYLASQGVPTFGLNVNSQWTAGPSMFGNNGSYLDLGSPVVQAAFLAEQQHVHSAAVLAYNVAQSQEGCKGFVAALQGYGIKIGFEDMSIPAPASDLHADVNRMKQAGVDMVVSCMDVSGNVLLSQTMQQSGMSKVTQLWNDGYDEAALAQHASAMDGAYFFQPNVPFEVGRLYPGRYPGMDRFLAMLKRYAPGTEASQAALAGWTSADLFVTGLRKIGHDVTRSGLVDAINHIGSFTADGILAPVDWRTAHSSAGPINCSAFVQVRGSRFVPVYGTGRSVFTCFSVPAPASPPVRPLSELPAGVPPG